MLSHHPGRLNLDRLPGTKADAEALWSWAKRHCLPEFGPYQDAMSSRSSSLFHTRTSALMNIHRLLPVSPASSDAQVIVTPGTLTITSSPPSELISIIPSMPITEPGAAVAAARRRSTMLSTTMSCDVTGQVNGAAAGVRGLQTGRTLFRKTVAVGFRDGRRVPCQQDDEQRQNCPDQRVVIHVRRASQINRILLRLIFRIVVRFLF